MVNFHVIPWRWRNTWSARSKDTDFQTSSRTVAGRWNCDVLSEYRRRGVPCLAINIHRQLASLDPVLALHTKGPSFLAQKVQ